MPIGFKNPELSDNSEIVGGSPYGAAAVAGGDGSREVSEKELKIAREQGSYDFLLNKENIHLLNLL